MKTTTRAGSSPSFSGDKARRIRSEGAHDLTAKLRASHSTMSTNDALIEIHSLNDDSTHRAKRMSLEKAI